MHDRTGADGVRTRNAWWWVVGGAAVIGALWFGPALYQGGGWGAFVRQGTTAGGAAGESGGRQAMTAGTTPQAAAAPRPLLDLVETPAVETATFALG